VEESALIEGAGSIFEGASAGIGMEFWSVDLLPNFLNFVQMLGWSNLQSFPLLQCPLA
jgi:hypothetical protein